jgi:hypothetical protein
VSRRRPTWQKILVSLALIAVAIFSVSSLVQTMVEWARSEPREFLGFVLYFVVILIVAFLSAKFEIVDRSVSRALAMFVWFIVYWFITLMPLYAFAKLSEFVLVKLTVVFQIIVFLLWGLGLVWALLRITTESNREWLFHRLQKAGRFTPFIYSFCLLWIATMFFSSVTYVLVDHGLMRISGLGEWDIPPEAARDISPQAVLDFYRLIDFYLWHFLAAVPLLEVNETLHWEKPLTYDSAWVGLVLLVFKATVIVPVIAAFAWYWAYLGRKLTKSLRQ